MSGHGRRIINVMIAIVAGFLALQIGMGGYSVGQRRAYTAYCKSLDAVLVADSLCVRPDTTWRVPK